MWAMGTNTRPPRRDGWLRCTTQTVLSPELRAWAHVGRAAGKVLLEKPTVPESCPPFHPPSLKEELWLNFDECNFILLEVKRHNTLNKGYWNRNTFITKNQKKKKKQNQKQFHIVLSYNMAADKKKNYCTQFKGTLNRTYSCCHVTCNTGAQALNSGE